MSEPAYPVKELIVQAVVAALGQISTANGYATDGVQVVRPRRTGEQAACTDKQIRVIQGVDERSPNDDLNGRPAPIGWRFAIQMDVIIRLSEKSTTPMDQTLNLFEADVRKAVMVDDKFGGLCLRSELGPTQYPEGDDGLEGVTVWLYVTYRVMENDPYVNAA